IAAWLTRLGREPLVVRTKERPVPLKEIFTEELPYRAPKAVTGFWPRIATGVLMADMGPLLIFAPQRSAAEKIARKIASALPSPNPLHLTPEQTRACGKDLAKLLSKRVALHHSGLPYAARAGVVEPLAKAGQLSVIVATTGLAAGINFSVRSVIVSDTIYIDGYGAEQSLAHDDLLQMFGRAGRRGLDDTGFVVCAKNSPSLSDAAPKLIRRTNEIDWPTLIREMERASESATTPFDAARALCKNLFSDQQIHLGVRESDHPPTPSADDGSRDMFGLGPTQDEIFASNGHWEKFDSERATKIPLELATIYFRNYLEPALAVSEFVAHTFPHGRVCKINHADGFHYYGKEIALAVREKSNRFRLTRTIGKHLKIPKENSYTYDQIEDQILPLLEPDYFMAGRIFDISIRNDLFTVSLDFCKTPHAAYHDSQDVYLIEAEHRNVPVEAPTTVITNTTDTGHLARRNSPAEAWRTLGLIEADGTPTIRGKIFACFQGGEGLAVAAALGDDSYPVDELVYHLANLRAGRRFENFTTTPSERLASVCRSTYGGLNYDGYLDVGLPTNFGTGATEAVIATITTKGKISLLTNGELGSGDIERAVVEWLSILRHITHARDLDHTRWLELKKTAANTLAKHAGFSPTTRLPALPAAQLINTPKHKLYPSHFHG
ncbi:MAG: helicase-related protein, partial [Verrucomicrobiales bacterium]|nr:helicase-related protein [Verrucomicrobiales bacterium]